MDDHQESGVNIVDAFGWKKEEKQKSQERFNEIEQIVQGRLVQMTKKLGATYISPTQDELDKKYTLTTKNQVPVDYFIGDNGRIAMLSGYARGYNDGQHGFIVQEKKETKEEFVRLYRGGIFNADIHQVASLARVDGIEISDIYEYMQDDTSMDNIVDKAIRPEQNEFLKRDLKSIRTDAKRRNISEKQEIMDRHTAYTSGAITIDVYVAASKEPENVYSLGGEFNSPGGFVDNDGNMYSVLVIDVPMSHYKDFRSEAGILAEIKPEWIRAIVPSVGHKETVLKNIAMAEKIIDSGNG